MEAGALGAAWLQMTELEQALDNPAVVGDSNTNSPCLDKQGTSWHTMSPGRGPSRCTDQSPLYLPAAQRPSIMTMAPRTP
jgi:hypothetical protein